MIGIRRFWPSQRVRLLDSHAGVMFRLGGETGIIVFPGQINPFTVFVEWDGDHAVNEVAEDDLALECSYRPDDGIPVKIA